jgi:hypothetical protein
MSLEERVRAATCATAGTVGHIRPLDLPEELPLRLPRPRLRRPWAMWIATVTAAAVVAALAVALVSIREHGARRRLLPHSPPSPASPRSRRSTLQRSTRRTPRSTGQARVADLAG